MIGGPTEVEVYHAPYKEGPGMEEAILYPLPPPADVAPRRLTDAESARVDLLCRLLFFLATAPTKWSSLPASHLPDLSKFRLPNGEDVACVLWNGLYHITGTDIVRALLFRFEAFGRPVKHTKKWEEGVFSDLRNLKPGVDACLEEPKSAFLDFLFRNGCIRTQKKQKVFYWFSVPHDRLFLDALERDLKREKAGQEPTSVVVGEPARSFKYDPRRGLYEQFMGSNRGMEAAILDQVYPLQARLAPGGGMLPMGASRQSSIDPTLGYDGGPVDPQNPWGGRPGAVDPSGRPMPPEFFQNNGEHPYQSGPGGLPQFTVTMFEGSAAYKRKRVRSKRSSPAKSVEPKGEGEEEERDDRDGSEVSEDKKRKIASRSSTAAPEGSTGTPSNGATDEKSFVCVFEFCRRPFKRLEHLKRHIRTHTQERPFACKLCSRAFSRQDNLLQHLRLHRKDDPPRANDVNEDRLSAPPNSQYSAVPAYGGGMGQYRSTTVPPDWLSMPPPNAPWSTPPQAVSSHPSFSPVPQQPMRFRSATPQMAAPSYSYGSMPPPPPPSQGMMQGLNVATGTPHAPYPFYSAEPQSANDYPFSQPAGWTPVDSAISGGATPLDGTLDPALQGPPPHPSDYEGRVGSGSDLNDPNGWQALGP